MKLYEDANLQQLIGESFTFGIVPVGQTFYKTIWLKNEAIAPHRTGLLKELTYEVVCLDPENGTVITDEKVIILEAPTEMQPYEVATIKLEWTPNVDLEQKLRAKINIRAKKII